MADDTSESGTSVVEKIEDALEDVEHDLEERLPEGAVTPAPGLLPGELIPHPSPFKYVMIAVILVVITAVEVAVSYMEGWLPDGAIVFLLIAMAIAKFWIVASWYMHLRTDQPIFRRMFLMGLVAAVVLFAIVLATFHVII